MHNLDFLMPGEKARCFASTSLPLSMPINLSCYSDDPSTLYQEPEVRIPTDAETFEVTIQRNSLGLGLSIMGGPDAPPPFKHLFRIKKLFPLQPAWQTGLIRPGDILLEANHQSLTGMSLRQALDILRCSPPVTTLLICRPKSELFVAISDEFGLSNSPKVARSYSYTPAARQFSLSLTQVETSENMDCDRYHMSTPDPDTTEQNNQFNQQPMDLFSPILVNNNNNNTLSPGTPSDFYGEFTIRLRKVNGSLGFTLYSQTDDSTVLRHSVKALVKEPAISDGRIRAGDKLVSANGIECGHLSHQDLIQFLRKCPDDVILKFYRDASRSQTPVSTPQHPQGPLETGGKKSFFFSDKSKFGNFFSNVVTSSSHPDLAQSSQQTTKPKQLRAEAKEMVRSLQASRNSLETAPETGTRTGSNASGGGGSRRKIRPFSPARPQHHPICLSASAPSPFPKHLVAANMDSLSSSPVNSPTVESPMTPSINSSMSGVLYHPDPYHDPNGHSSLGMERLRIEELPSDERETLSLNFQSTNFYNFPQNSLINLERPTELDLFGHQKKKQNFIFNK